MTAIDEGLTAIYLETPTSRAFGMGAWVYLVDGVLVDSGFPHARRALLRALAGRRVERLVNTHVHEDHVGNDAAVATTFGATVLSSKSTLHLLADPAGLHLRFYERLIWGRPDPCATASPLGETVETARGRLEVVPTPGHSPDHVAFFEPERRVLFSGDLFLTTRERAARPFHNVADHVASLRRVLALRPRRLFCAHRGAVDDAVPALEAKLRVVEAALERVRRLHQAGLSIRAIGVSAFGRASPGSWLLTGGDFSRAHMVRACLKEPGTGYRQDGSVDY